MSQEFFLYCGVKIFYRSKQSTKIKNLFLTLTLCLSFIISNAQEVFILSPIIVADEDKDDFESIQSKYVSPLAQDAGDGKSMKGWVLLKKIPGFGSPDNKMDYV